MSGAELRCPKCGGEMPSWVRNGVQIEQCRDCHGIFLDRGEFERLTALERSPLGTPTQPAGEAEDDPPTPQPREFAFLG